MYIFTYTARQNKILCQSLVRVAEKMVGTYWNKPVRWQNYSEIIWPVLTLSQHIHV